MKTKILILCDFYLPSVRAGGPVRSISAIVEALKNEFDITIITRNHDIGLTTPFNESEIIHEGYRVLYFSDAKLMSGIRDTLASTHFDIIYFNSFVAPRMTIFTLFYLLFKRKPTMLSRRRKIQSGALAGARASIATKLAGGNGEKCAIAASKLVDSNSGMCAVGAAKLVSSDGSARASECEISRQRLIISPRGELGLGALTIKSKRKKIYIAIFKRLFLKSVEFLATSDSEKNEIQQSLKELPCSCKHQHALAAKKLESKATTPTITVLPNLTTHVKSTDIINVKKENQINIVFLSRISKKKNLLGAIQILEKVKGRVNVDIFGPIEDEPYWDECQAAIKQLPAHIQVNYRGGCDPDQVSNTLKPYDLFFLPSWNENYGHVIVESLAVGCPVLLSDQTPWHDLVDHDAGWEFSLNELEKFAQKIDQLIAKNTVEYALFKNAALQYYLEKIVNPDLENNYIKYFRSCVGSEVSEARV